MGLWPSLCIFYFRASFLCGGMWGKEVGAFVVELDSGGPMDSYPDSRKGASGERELRAGPSWPDFAQCRFIFLGVVPPPSRSLRVSYTHARQGGNWLTMSACQSFQKQSVRGRLSTDG